MIINRVRKIDKLFFEGKIGVSIIVRYMGNDNFEKKIDKGKKPEVLSEETEPNKIQTYINENEERLRELLAMPLNPIERTLLENNGGPSNRSVIVRDGVTDNEIRLQIANELAERANVLRSQVLAEIERRNRVDPGIDLDNNTDPNALSTLAELNERHPILQQAVESVTNLQNLTNETTDRLNTYVARLDTNIQNIRATRTYLQAAHEWFRNARDFAWAHSSTIAMIMGVLGFISYLGYIGKLGPIIGAIKSGAAEIGRHVWRGIDYIGINRPRSSGYIGPNGIPLPLIPDPFTGILPEVNNNPIVNHNNTVSAVILVVSFLSVTIGYIWQSFM